MKTVFVTGGNGFLGRQIVAACKAKGYNVLAPRSSEINFMNKKGMQEFFSKNDTPIDCLINSMAYYGGLSLCISDPAGLIVRNAQLITNVFEMVRDYKIKKVISIGSACAYPGNIFEDLKEDRLFDGRCHDSVEAYGFTKRIQMVMQNAFHKQYGTECNHIIINNLYGEHDVFIESRAHAISALIKKIADAKLTGTTANAWGTGKPKREFVYVKDVARLAAETVELKGDLEGMNIGGHEISIYDLTVKICELIGLSPDRVEWDHSKPDGVMRKTVNQEKLKRELPGFKLTGFEEALKQTVEWYLENKEIADARQ